MTARYYVPAFDRSEAREIACAVHAGRMGHIEHYLDASAARRVCDHLNRLGSKRRAVFAVEVDELVTDDGTIPVARLIDQAGSVAASLLLIIGGPVLVGIATLI